VARGRSLQLVRVTVTVLAIVLWTVAVVAGVALLSPGQVPPCPEANPVGLSDSEREAILAMCAQRAPVSPGPMIGALVWVAGSLVISGIAIVATRARHYGNGTRGGRPGKSLQ